MKYGIYFAYWERQWAVDYKKYISKVKSLGFDILEISCAAKMILASNAVGVTAVKSRPTDVPSAGRPVHFHSVFIEISIRFYAIICGRRLLA